MIDVAYAMAPSGGQGGGDMNTLISFLPMVLIFAVFYFLLIRPQQQKAKEHRKVLDNLKKGDSVLTQGGIYGKVAHIADQVVTLEVADKIKIQVARSYVVGLAAPGSEPEGARKG